MYLVKQKPYWIWGAAVAVGEFGYNSNQILTPSLSPRIMEVAREFPHCSAVAVDLVPMQSL